MVTGFAPASFSAALKNEISLDEMMLRLPIACHVTWLEFLLTLVDCPWVSFPAQRPDTGTWVPTSCVLFQPFIPAAGLLRLLKSVVT